MHLDEKYLKVIEAFGELLIERDKKILFKDYEIEALKNKIDSIERKS